jgi:hypothetical protein
MDARIEGQLAGVVRTVPTRGSGPSLDSRAQSPTALKRSSNADSPADLPDLDFDANGDGAIEHWSFAHGGDSFATFKPPPGGAAGSNLRRVSHAPAAGSALRSRPSLRARRRQIRLRRRPYRDRTRPRRR